MKNGRIHHQRRRGGFTLIEAIATITVLSVLGSMASFLIVNAVDGYVGAATSSQIHAELAIALDRLTRDIRKIDNDATAGPTDPDIDTVTRAGTEDAMTWTDSDGDAYSLSKTGSNLMLAVDGGAAAVLLSDVTAFAIEVYNQDNGVIPGGDISTTDCDPIRRVLLDVSLSRHNVTESLRSKVFIRSSMSGGG